MKPLFFLLAIIVPLALTAQISEKTLLIKKVKGTIKVDGDLNEPDWKLADTAGNFYQTFPYDTSSSVSKTEVWVTYDDHFLYVGAMCYDTLTSCDYVITSLKRDWSYPVNDAFVVTIDPFNDKTNGFSFGVNPYGVQREGLIANGGTQGVSTDWDNRWYSQVKCVKGGYWTVEMAIPFKTLRFKPGTPNWGINFSRNDLKRNENSCWNRVPRQFNIATLAYAGKMVWDVPKEKTGTNISIIPYGIAGGSSDYTKSDKVNFTYNAGLDAKIAVSSSLNLDITVNPDFSQVDVDRQVTNLTRFSLFFPERRNFFIENSDLFARYGFSTIRPFFSRRIGLEAGQVIPIAGGMRLSGKINNNWRIGVMDMQTQSYNKNGLTLNSQNYGVFALQRQVMTKSNIGIIAVNRQAFKGNGELINNDFNRILGIDYNHLSKNNKLQGKVFYHYAFTPVQLKNSFSHAVWADYNDKNFTIDYNHEIVGENYQADVGFVPRLYNYDPTTGKNVRIGFVRYEDYVAYRFFSKSGKVLFHGPMIYFNQYSKLSNLQVNDRLLDYAYLFQFKNQSSFRADFNQLFTRLYFPTDVTQSGSSTLLAAGSYNYQNVKIQYNSSFLKKLNGLLGLSYGTYYTGNIFSLNSELNYRLQPYGNFTLTYSRDYIQMPASFNSATLHLLSARSEITLSRSFFFTTFVQYNTQINNLNINSRIQWRFRPMSDLYLVYSDNYDPLFMKVRNRALVLKFVYWITV